MKNTIRTALFLSLTLLTQTAMSQTIEFVVDGKAFSAQLLENDAAKSFADQLPLTLKFEDFGSTERIAMLNQKLTMGTAPQECDPVRGTISYYIPWGNLAIFRTSFRHSPDLVPLGKMSEEALQAVEASGEKAVTIRLAK